MAEQAAQLTLQYSGVVSGGYSWHLRSSITTHRFAADCEGLAGLLPHKRGPKQPHKLNDEILAMLASAVHEQERMLSGEELALLLAQQCGIRAHPRSIIRRLLPYLRWQEKNTPDCPDRGTRREAIHGPLRNAASAGDGA
jgi:hypothetical protein